VCYFEPVLARLNDYKSHPAFSSCSLETSVCDGSIAVKRRPRARGRGIALAFDCDCPFTVDTSRESALGRGGIRALPAALKRPSGGTVGAVLDPCVLARIPVRLEPNVTSRIKFALATSSTIQSASAAAKRILLSDGSGYSRLDETAHDLGLGAEQIGDAMALLPGIVYHSPDRRTTRRPRRRFGAASRGYGAFGVSGDLPIAAVEVAGEDDIAEAGRMLDAHRLLSASGVPFDLVFLVKGGGDYRSRLKNVLTESLKLSEPDRRYGARGGVHIAELPSDGAELVRAAAVVTAGLDGKMHGTVRDETPTPSAKPFLDERPAGPLEYGYNADNSCTFKTGELPKNAWSHMLASETFGYLATDAGTGHMWHLNARENKINRWLNDSLTTDGTEKLEVILDGKNVSVFAAPDGNGCEITYGFGWAEWRKQIGGATFTTTAFVPPDVSARILIVEAEGAENFDVA
jgi:cyclic beta-1,2-glucan synthetase